MSRSVPWAKIWWTWYTSRSHIGLSGVGLALGPPLMLLGRACADRHSDGHSDASCDGRRDASGDAECDLVWLKNEDESNVSAADLAAIARFDEASVQAALDALVKRRTLTVSVEGCYGIPNFWRYQESAAAARTRKYRDKEKRHRDGVGDGSGDAQCDGVCDDKRIEVRGKSNTVPSEQCGVAGPKTKRAKSAALVALESALKAKLGTDAPALSRSQGQKAAHRLAEHAREQGCTLDAAAALLVASYAALGVANAWKLLDVPFRARVAPVGARTAPAPGTTAADFEDAEDIETQIARKRAGVA